ncbi:MAG: glycosyltransferase family 2 protein [Candidatus Abyssobacteria bacterium SURF_5]|uniref:Glycosyltransferase family 2 protein n=1 Tax=Abyssobacteria bacterium (strain SURF_5) TaxID=2093360 RepID=A0A3A4NNK5_ABYX5|nr:MAG: glycosyltransferase family 2 protein [Candidatus Abyssubacteria bacterium SURF_5]
MPNSKKSISVIISTFNRADLLRDAGRSVLEQEFDPQEYELVIVDNNCVDSTPEVVRQLIDQYNRHSIVYIQEREQGLSAARNAGARAACGEIVAFMDDDSEADSQWLHELWSVYRAFPQAASVGGKILPVWIGAKPEWFNGIAENINRLDRGDQIKEFVFPEHPFGGNLSARRDVLLSLGGFSQMLGRKKQGLLSNEEKEFYYRLSRLTGFRTLYAPAAVVYHKSYGEKMTRSYVLKRFYWQGVSESLFEQLTGAKTRRQLLGLGVTRAWRIVLLAWKLLKDRTLVRKRSRLDGVLILCQEIGKCKMELAAGMRQIFGKPPPERKF